MHSGSERRSGIDMDDHPGMIRILDLLPGRNEQYVIDVELMEKEVLAFGRREGGKQFIIKNNSPAELLFIKCPDSR